MESFFLDNSRSSSTSSQAPVIDTTNPTRPPLRTDIASGHIIGKFAENSSRRRKGIQSDPFMRTIRPTQSRSSSHASPTIDRARNRRSAVRMPGTFPESIASRSRSSTPQIAFQTPPPRSEEMFDQISILPRAIDDKIRKRLREPLTVGQVSSDAKGYVYILEAVDEPGLFKIGSTDKTVTERKQQIQQACGRPLNECYRSEPLGFAQRAEKLCHDMLHFFRRPYACARCVSSSTKQATCHEEWFKVPLEVAIDCVKLWTTFLRTQPFDSYGKLIPFWQERLQHLQACSDNETHSDHRLRLRRWEGFAVASDLDYAIHCVGRVLRGCRYLKFWKKWFMFLLFTSLFLSFLLSFLPNWLGDLALRLQFCISLGYFLPVQLVHVPKKTGVTGA